jgi:hypothetical protein
MSDSLSHRLEQILPRVTSADFLTGDGIGNEIACYIFDYPADAELEVREHIQHMLVRLANRHDNVKVLHLDLLDVVVDLLRERKLLDKALEMQHAKGDTVALKALAGPLSAERVRDFIAKTYKLQDHDLVFLSGIGSVWPTLRAHSLLNCLHTVMGATPLVMFYPGSFDGTTLSLFDKVATSTSTVGTRQYYRAFILVPRETQS